MGHAPRRLSVGESARAPLGPCLVPGDNHCPDGKWSLSGHAAQGIDVMVDLNEALVTKRQWLCEGMDKPVVVQRGELVRVILGAGADKGGHQGRLSGAARPGMTIAAPLWATAPAWTKTW